MKILKQMTRGLVLFLVILFIGFGIVKFINWMHQFLGDWSLMLPFIPLVFWLMYKIGEDFN